MKKVAIWGFIITVSSFLLTLFLLEKEDKIIGYIVSCSTLIIISLVELFLWIKGQNNTKPLIQVFKNRDDMLHEWPYKKIILEDSKQLCILGGTLREFIDDEHLELLLEYVKDKDKKCKILMQNPASQGSYLRALEEGGQGRIKTVYADIHISMENLLKFIHSEISSEHRKRFEVRKYSSVPSSSMFITDNKIAYTYYLYETRSSKSLWYLLHNTKQNVWMKRKLMDQFNKIWEDSIDINEMDNFVMLFEGLPGAGKTYTANYLASNIANAKLVSSAQIRLETGLTEIFSEEQKMAIYNIVLQRVSELIYKGERRIIIDGNFLKEKQRDMFFALFEKMEIDTYYFKIEASLDDVKSRLKDKINSDELYKRIGVEPNHVISQVELAWQRVTEIEEVLIGSIINYNTSKNKIEYKAKNYVTEHFSKSIKNLLLKS